MDLVWKMLEGGATVIENIIIYDFYSKFFGYKRESVYNKAILLVFLVITSLCSIAITELFSFSGYATYLCIGIIVLYGFIFLKGNTVFIAKTYREISKGDYISNLVQEKQKEEEQKRSHVARK